MTRKRTAEEEKLLTELLAGSPLADAADIDENLILMKRGMVGSPMPPGTARLIHVVGETHRQIGGSGFRSEYAKTVTPVAFLGLPLSLPAALCFIRGPAMSRLRMSSSGNTNCTTCSKAGWNFTVTMKF
jgi:hypothetical protein